MHGIIIIIICECMDDIEENDVLTANNMLDNVLECEVRHGSRTDQQLRQCQQQNRLSGGAA